MSWRTRRWDDGDIGDTADERQGQDRNEYRPGTRQTPAEAQQITLSGISARQLS